MLRAIALAGLLTAACSLALALTNDGVSGVQVALLEWISVPYIAAGLSRGGAGPTAAWAC